MHKEKRFFFSRSYKLEARSYSRGVSLIDVVVGSALMLLVFMGISAVFQLSVQVVSNNKARAGAVALSGERMEYIRSLAYDSVGTAGGIPAGAIEQSETVSLNGIPYTRRTFIAYVDDPGDGTGGSDENAITLDYKAARVDVSWASKEGDRHIILVTRIEPPNGMEIACPPLTPCGTLEITVVDEATEPVGNAQVHIVNSGTSPAIDITTFTNVDGMVVFGGAPEATGYEVTVTKTGYNSDQTYAIANPVQGPLTVSANQTTSGIFRIDLLASKTVYTYALTTGTWEDTFSDESKIGLSTNNIEISGNRARFAGNQPWTAPADLYSQTITPSALSRWGVFSWDDTQPAETTVTYHVYYLVGSTLTLLPDSVLAGNGTGFSTGTSVDLSGVPADTYASLVLYAYLVALNPSAPSPSVEDWSLTYESGQGTAVSFTMQGAKVIGNGPPPVYKYDESLSTNSSGILAMPDIEWDTYRILVPSSTGYDIASSCRPQPEYLAPGSSTSTRLYLTTHTAHSLLIDVSSAGAPVTGASVSVWKDGTATTTKTTDSCGQAFFGSLSETLYFVSVAATAHPVYWNTSPGVNVSGQSLSPAILN
jgi:hypothetical protein